MKAAIYTRFSTDKQQSTKVQISLCQEYAKANKISIVGVYSDEATTGTNADRGSFERLVFDAQNKKFDAIIIYDITRGSRDVGDWFNFRKLMRSLNINVLSTSEHLGDILNPSDFLTELLTIGIGQHHVLTTRVKSIDGKTHHAKNAEFQGGIPPLGYDVKDKQYFINEYEAKAVRLIFSLYASGKSYNYILDELNNLGYRGKRGQKLGKNSLYSILRNDRYTGHYSWNRNINTQMKKWVGLKNANPNCVEIPNGLPRIIDEITWEKVKERTMSREYQGKNKAIEPYLLSGKIICDACGGHYVGHTSTNSKGVRTRSYVCGNKYRNKTCKAPNFNADWLDAQLVFEMRAWLANQNPEEYVDNYINLFTAKSKVDKSSLYEERQNLERKIKNAVILLTETPDLTPIRDEMIRMQMRLADINILTNEEVNVIDRDEIVAVLSEDMKNCLDISAERLVERYLKEIHALNGHFSVIGGVYMTGSPSRI